ncbi:Dimethylaniline monooxygenase [N-oxide-forming] 5 [Aphelenchoides besseyi]|nr:Dimethylaniline monooxygenase [N-oxide-forming] 5 [Aphelenchoides besseyi]
MQKRVAVIGAGASGLPSARWALAYEWEPVVFEMQNNIGGLWRYKEEDSEVSTVMKSTIINTSKEMTAYSDFTPLSSDPNYMHNKNKNVVAELLKYLQDYADSHDVTKHVRLNHRVNSVNRASDYEQTGRWIVNYTDSNGEIKDETFDAVLSAVGHHATPRMPRWKGQDDFQGQILHSKQYRDHRGYEDKNIVVVGVGNSGLDIACELGRVAKQVYLSTRRGVWVCTKVVDYGTPLDLWLNRRINTYLRLVLPSWVYPWLLERKLQKTFDHDKYGLRPAHSTVAQHVSMSDELHGNLCSGRVVAKSNIRTFTATGVVFEDDTKVDADVVILSTGYSFNFSFIENGQLIPVEENRVRLYKGMYPASESKHNTLAVIGLLQPIGSLMPVSEMQARLFFHHLNGDVKLPSEKEMNAEIDVKLERLHERYNNSARHTIQVDYTEYMSELGDLIDCTPRPLDFLFADPQLCYQLIFGPDVPYCYRLRGPHKWEKAREAILGVDDRFVKAVHTREGAKPSFQFHDSYLYAFLALLLFAFLFFR